MGADNSNQGEMKGGKSKTGVIALSIVIVALLGVIVFLVTSNINQKTEVVESEKRSVVVTADNVNEVVDDMIEAKDEDVAPNIAYYSATMNYEWRFPTGASPSSNAYVENNKDNSTDVYFDLFLADNEDEAIYESPIIPVGESVGKFALSKNLGAGTYDCVCIYHLVDENQNTLSTLRVKVTVIVEQ